MSSSITWCFDLLLSAVSSSIIWCLILIFYYLLYLNTISCLIFYNLRSHLLLAAVSSFAIYCLFFSLLSHILQSEVSVICFLVFYYQLPHLILSHVSSSVISCLKFTICCLIIYNLLSHRLQSPVPSSPKPKDLPRKVIDFRLVNLRHSFITND